MCAWTTSMPPRGKSNGPVEPSSCRGSKSPAWGASFGSESPVDRSWRRGKMRWHCRRSVTEHDECKGHCDGVPESTRKVLHGLDEEVSSLLHVVGRNVRIVP